MNAKQDEYFAELEAMRIRKAFPIAHCLSDIMREHGHKNGTGHVEDLLSEFLGQIRCSHPRYWPEDYNPIEAMQLLEVLGLVDNGRA
jgi:hypothetical protein